MSAAVRYLHLPPIGWAGTLGDVLPTWLHGLGFDAVSIPTENRPLLSVIIDYAEVLTTNFYAAGDATVETLGIFIGESFAKAYIAHENRISEIESKFIAAEHAYIDPLALDLNGDGVTTTSLNNNHIYFDLNNNGFAERTGWVNSDDSILVRDLNSNGKIDGGQELFGTKTVMSNGSLASNGFEALADLGTTF